VLLIAVYCFKMTEWSAPDVERETGLVGISASPVSVNGLVPYTVCVDWLLDRIPVINKLNYNPHREGEDPSTVSGLDLLGEPMMIGGLMGLALATAAGYGLGATLELAVHIAAVMFLLPKSAGLIGDAMMPVTVALRDQVTRFFPHRKNLIVAMDTGFLMHHKAVMVTGLILMTLAVPIALVLPGNRVLPLGDLPNLISVMALSVLILRGNVFRAVVAGIPVIITFLLISSKLAPLITQLASQTAAFNSAGLGQITAFTDGGHQLRFLIYSLYQGELWAILTLPLLLGAIVMVWRRFRVSAPG
jgi:PTS system galactitol-specific IIC component